MIVPARLLVAILALGISNPAAAAIEAFLMMDGVRGDAVDARHQGEMEVLSFSHGIVHATPSPGGAGGGGASKPVLSELTITRRLDRATPVLHQRAAQGAHFRNAVLTLRNSGPAGTVFYQVKLTDVRIVSVGTAGVAGDDGGPPVETLALGFGRIEWVYTPQDRNGSTGAPVEGSWDVVRGTP